ncbi:DNA adenine methylase [Listeria monocytogenes]|nr:DNA adenine methylase [Listeria monocytogenes]ECP9685345.1 DNA adenine methylase [Listeria monocytogenes]
MKRILNYPGSKWSLADFIIDNMPAHKSSLEPFCGSCAVFMNKQKAKLETINDVDGRLVNLFKVMRDNPENLQYLIMHTLYSREEYVLSHKISSGYESELYKQELTSWEEIKTMTKVGITSEKKSDRQEIIWCNFEPPIQLNLFKEAQNSGGS